MNTLLWSCTRQTSKVTVATWHFTSEQHWGSLHFWQLRGGIRRTKTYQTNISWTYISFCSCLSYKAAHWGKTNLFHSPRRVKTDSILDLRRFQRKSVGHVHTQHCHYWGMSPSMTISWLSHVSPAVKEHCQCDLERGFFVERSRFNFCVFCCRKASCVLIGPKFVTRSNAFCRAAPVRPLLSLATVLGQLQFTDPV